MNWATGQYTRPGYQEPSTEYGSFRRPVIREGFIDARDSRVVTSLGPRVEDRPVQPWLPARLWDAAASSY